MNPQNASRDQNSVATLLAESSVDGTPVTLIADPTTHRLLVDNANTGAVTIVSDGVHTVTSAQEIEFTSGATVTDLGGGIAGVAITAAGSGTVTSVAVAGSDGILVSGSPITTAGTIGLNLGAITPSSVN